MTVRVNLLPAEVVERVRQRRMLGFSAAGLVVVVLLIGLLYALQVAAVSRTRAERDEEQVSLAQLQARVAELEPFRQLALSIDARETLLAAAMGQEVSWARVLNDLAIVFPSNSSLLTLAANATIGTVQADAVDAPANIGTVTFSGYTVDRYAPGVEALLLRLDQVEALFGIYLGSASAELVGTTEVTSFNGTARIGPEAFSRRYVDGLPDEPGFGRESGDEPGTGTGP